MPLAFVTAGKLPSALAAGEWLLAGVCADVSGQVVAAAEVAHADAALERLVSRVHALMARQLVGTGEAATAAISRTDVGTFVSGHLALESAGNLFGADGFCQVRLRQNLGGEGFDGGQGRERRLQRQRRHALRKPGVRARPMVANLRLLGQEIIWEHRYCRG